jgi:hypothetical protein
LRIYTGIKSITDFQWNLSVANSNVNGYIDVFRFCFQFHYWESPSVKSLGESDGVKFDDWIHPIEIWQY